MKTVPLKDIASVRLGFPFKGALKPSHEGSVSVVQLRDLTSEEIINWEQCARITPQWKRAPARLKAGDILFPTRGNILRAIVVDKGCQNYQVVASSYLFVIRLNPSMPFLPAYVAWWLNQKYAQHVIRSCSQSSTMFMSLSAAILGCVPVAKVPLEKQKAILRFNHQIKEDNALLRRMIDNNNKIMAHFVSQEFKQLSA